MRIAIVNDVPMAIEAVRRVVIDGRDRQLAWIAYDGAQAVKLCFHDRPDLILMDLVMPELDGVEATRRIMAQTPCAIVVVTANVTDNSSRVFEAMGAGALDAVNTPVLECVGSFKGATALLAKIETIRRLLGLPNGHRPNFADREAPSLAPHHPHCLVAIGASAGGPGALAKLLGGLAADFPAPLVLVQHVDSQFAPGLANWLDHQTRLQVRVAQDGDHPEPGTALLAGREQHLVLAGPGRLAYTPEPHDCSYRPSIDVFFKSVQHWWPGEAVGVLLTGMGRDGAEGLQALHRHGHHTIAQDQTTSAVYGMPKAAADLGAASEILALDKIGARLTNLVAKAAKPHD